MEWLGEPLEVWILWYRCELIVKFILVISSFHLFEEPVYLVFNWTQELLVQFVRLPKSIDIAERVLQGLAADWMITKNVQQVDISIF